MNNFTGKNSISKVLLLGGESASLINFRAPLLGRLVAMGHQVHVAASQASAQQIDTLRNMGAEFHAVPFERAGMNPARDLRSLWALRKLMRRIKPHALIAYTSKPVVYGVLAARLARVPLRVAMITGLGYSFIDGPELKRRVARFVSTRLYSLALPFCTRVIFQNLDDLAEFQRRGILRANAATAIVNGSGVDIAHYAPAPLPPDPVFLLIGRLLADKGIREYAAAARIVREHVPQARFLLLGGLDPSPNSVTSAELRVWQNHGIEYLGESKDVRPMIASASVVVLPSYREGTPRSVLEGMAMGRAIVTTDAPGCRETVVDGKNGFLVKSRDVNDLARAMLIVAEDAGLRARMGVQSRAIAVSRYDAAVVAADTAEKAGLHALDGK